MNAFCGQVQTSLLTELRFVSREVGYETARRMPTEIRRWWITQMQKEVAPEPVSPNGNRVKTMDVPRGRQG